MTTIYDIAKETGYAPSTVSKTLNGYKGVSKKAKAIINNAAKEMHYIPNLNARMLMTKKSYMIGILLSEESEMGMLHPHFSEILENFKKKLEFYGYDIVFLNRRIGNNEVTFLDHCKHRGIDGVMLAVSSSTNKAFKQLALDLVNSDIPKISVEDIYNNIPTIISDNYTGAKEAMGFLYNSGHRNIGLVKLKPFNIASSQREKGYMDFMKEKKLKINKDIVYDINTFTYEEGIRIGKKIITNSKATAFFVVYDEIAIGIMEVLKENKISVPEDISIVGFDDLTIAKHFNLTTVKQNRKAIGEIAAEKLIKIIENDEREKTEFIPTKLIIRESVASC
ncbi:MAG: LacI family DNA-binding transcriptional regulator [Lachnospirales bacterium]